MGGLWTPAVSAPIGILDEHPEWSARLIAELDRRRLGWEKVDHSSHGYDPRERRPNTTKNPATGRTSNRDGSSDGDALTSPSRSARSCGTVRVLVHIDGPRLQLCQVDRVADRERGVAMVSGAWDLGVFAGSLSMAAIVEQGSYGAGFAAAAALTVMALGGLVLPLEQRALNAPDLLIEITVTVGIPD